MERKKEWSTEHIEKQKSVSARDIWICIIAYLAAGFSAYASASLLAGYHPIIIVLGADVTATCVIFIFSIIVNNSSMYDPYWSVAPPFILLFWILHHFAVTEGQLAGELSVLRLVVVLALVFFWAARLTYNWAHQWKGLSHEDWRYSDFRSAGIPMYWIISFFGFHLFPTLIVFLGSLPLYAVVTGLEHGITLLDGVATAVTVTAILLELISDRQLYRFRMQRTSSGQVCRQGLWRCSRHPNYLGEVLFWWGIFLFGIAASGAYLWTVIGPIIVTLLFIFLSIPMMEKRELKRKPDYREYRKDTPPLVPLLNITIDRSRRSG
jgi:steroid 5-alpha reductase family enzyme